MPMIFVLTIINNVNNICKNENHWSLLITRKTNTHISLQSSRRRNVDCVFTSTSEQQKCDLTDLCSWNQNRVSLQAKICAVLLEDEHILMSFHLY